MFDNVCAGYYISRQHWRQELTPLRTAQQYEIELYMTGQGASLIDAQRYPHAKGNLLFVRPGQRRQSHRAFECYYVHFSCPDGAFADKYLSPLPQVTRTAEPGRLGELFSDMIRAQAGGQAGWELFVQAKLLELAGELYYIGKTCRAGTDTAAPYSFDVYRAVEFMKENYARRLTLSDLAGAANLSPSYFHAVFKRTLGTTPRQYLLSLRLSHAKSLLRNSGKSIAQIAELCGFETQSYLSYVFQKELHVTPKYYRDHEIPAIL